MEHPESEYLYNLKLGFSVAFTTLFVLYVILGVAFFRLRSRYIRRKRSNSAQSHTRSRRTHSNQSVCEKGRSYRHRSKPTTSERLHNFLLRCYGQLTRFLFRHGKEPQANVRWMISTRTPISIHSPPEIVDSNWPLPSQPLPSYRSTSQILPSYRSPSPSPDTEAVKVLQGLGYSNYPNMQGLHGLGLDSERSSPEIVQDLEEQSSTTTATSHPSFYAHTPTLAGSVRSSCPSCDADAISKWAVTDTPRLTSIITGRTSSLYAPDALRHSCIPHDQTFILDTPISPISPITPVSNKTFTLRSLDAYAKAHPPTIPPTPLPTPISDYPAPLKPGKLKLRSGLSPSMSLRFSQWI